MRIHGFTLGLLSTLLLLLLLQQAQCQMERAMNRMMRRAMIRQMVTDMITRMSVQRAVSFVVGETAVPSQEMIAYASQTNASPSNPEQWNVYLDHMKKIARQTPEALSKFVETKTVNGKPVTDINMLKLDAYITRRSLMYRVADRARRARMQSQGSEQRQHEKEIARMNQMHHMNMQAMADALNVPVPTYSTVNSALPNTAGPDPMALTMLAGLPMMA